MSLPRPLVDHIIIQNIIIMVESTGVRGPTLARLAMVLVWQRAVNRQPGSRSITRRAGAPLLISFQIFDIFEIFEISTKISTFGKHLAPIELFYGIIISLFK